MPSSLPAYESPLRHHVRHASSAKHVKETLHARSEYTNSQDDGGAVHRINQYVIKDEIGRGSFGAVHLAVDQHGNEYVRGYEHPLVVFDMHEDIYGTFRAERWLNTCSA